MKASRRSAHQDQISYGSMASAIGRLWIAVSAQGLYRIGFDMPEEDFVGELRAASGQEPARDDAAIAGPQAQVEEYLAGLRTSFDLPLDLSGVGQFHSEALAACAGIPYGETRSYGELARSLGRPGAARAVGTAMARNPIPLVIPCHRVLRSTGALGGFGGGLNVKERLLHMEAENRRP